MAEAKKAITRDAHALIVEAERFLLDQNITREPGVAQKLQEKLEEMREILARETDDRSSIKSHMDELREVFSRPVFETRRSCADLTVTGGSRVCYQGG